VSGTELLVVLGLFYLIAPLVAWWHILRRLGQSPLLSLLLYVPLVNLAILYYVAFAKGAERQC
jgi:hypothetical protein